MPKTAIITGASGGIGAAAARRLAAGGFAVILGCHANEEQAQQLAREIRAAGGEAQVFVGDVRRAQDAQGMVRFALHSYGRLDVLVNNAGVSARGLVGDCTDDEYDRVMDTNLRGVFHLCREAVPPMVRAGQGAIVNVSSMWGLCGAAMESVYAASKGAVIAFSKSLAKELAPSGVSVACVAPGVVDTPMNGELSAPEREALASEIPLGRFATPAEMAETIYYLATAPYVSGTVICPSGGLVT